MASNIDPILLEVMRNAFHSVAEEMGAALIRAAYSTNIKDRRDCSCAIYTKDGDLVAQAENIPLHLGLMPSVVKAILKAYPVEQLEEGDVIMNNDPYISGSHLPDVTLMSPVYYGDEVIAVVANMAHHVDVGGMTPGSMPVGATEIFQEGLRIPPIKIQKKGLLDEEILRIIEANIRTGYVTKGDLRAQIAANNVGIKRIKELIDKYDAKLILEYMQAIMDYSERRMRKSIREIPNGVYSFEDYLEGDGISEDMIGIKATISVEDEDILIDFTGTNAQTKGGINCTRAVTLACVYYAIKSLVDPDVPPNEGAFRPIRVITPEATIVSPRFPAAVVHANLNTSQRIVDVILGAFKDCVPEKVMAACVGSMNIFTIGGINPDTDSYYSYIETYGGGQGAMYNQDGMDGVHTNMTNTRNAPVEAIENSYPLLVSKYGLVPGSGGPGKFRGGLGMTREITILGHEAKVTLSTERGKLRPWGILGGKSGGVSQCLLYSPDGQKKKLPSKTTMEVKPDYRIALITAGGGGAGNPLEREAQKVREDVIQGFVSLKEAEEEYGVILNPKTLEIEQEKTGKLRKRKTTP